MKNDEISQLVRMVQSKEDGSFERLYRKIWDTVFYYCRKQLGSTQDAEDASQEVIFKFYNAIDTMQNPEAANMFLYRTMSSVCVDWVRHQRVKPEEYSIEEADEAMLKDDEEFLPDEILQHKELREQVAELVDALPEKQREAIILFYFSGLKQAEISKITNSELSAVNNRLIKARKSLRSRAEELLKKGQWSYTMAATPILTQILQEDCIRICTSQISEKILLSVSEKIGLNPQLPQPTGAQNSAGATKSSVLINVGIAVAITFTLVVGGLLGRAVWREYIAPEPTPIVEQTEEIDDIIIALKKVQNKSEFEVFKVTYGFDASETVLHEDGMYQLYIGIRDGKQFRAGFLETESGAIATTYEIASLEAETPKNVREWFLANSS